MKSFYQVCISTLVAVGLAACDGPVQDSHLQATNAVSCKPFVPQLFEYKEVTDEDLPTVYAVSTQDQSCKTRYVQLDDCGTAQDAMKLFGYFQTKPFVMDADAEGYEAFSQQFRGDDQNGDSYKLPHLSCAKGQTFPLPSIEAGSFVVGESSELGRSSFQAKIEEDAQTIYSFPSSCLRLNAFFDLDRLFLDDRVKVLPELPRLGARDGEIRFACAYERPAALEKDVWRIYRIKVSRSAFYLLRYAAAQADEAVELLIGRVDGQRMTGPNAELEADLQATFKRSIETPDFAIDLAAGALDRPLLDICLKNCNGFIPMHEVRRDSKTERWLPRPLAAGMPPSASSFQLDATVLPDGQALDTVKLPSGKTMSFSSCSSGATHALIQRLGFTPSGKAPQNFEAWQTQVKDAVKRNVGSPLLVPCVSQAASCRVSIPAGMDLSQTMRQPQDGISSLIGDSRQRPECRDADTLRLELQGNAVVTSTAWTIGNPGSIKPYRTIQVIGRSPQAAISQELNCGDACGRSEAPVLRVLGDVTLHLQGFSILTKSSPGKVRTLAFVREGSSGSLAKTHLRRVIMGTNEKPFHSGMRLRAGLNFLHDLEIHAYFSGIKADSTLMTLTGTRSAGPLAANKSALIEVLDIGEKDAQPDPFEMFYRNSDGVALQAVKSRALLYLTTTRAPRAWMLGVDTEFKADMVDLANSANLLQDVSQAFLLGDQSLLELGSAKVQNFATLVNFNGFSVAQAQLKAANFLSGSFTTSPANFILNRDKGLINFDAETGSEMGLMCVEDAENPGHCIL